MLHAAQRGRSSRVASRRLAGSRPKGVLPWRFFEKQRQRTALRALCGAYAPSSPPIGSCCGAYASSSTPIGSSRKRNSPLAEAYCALGLRDGYTVCLSATDRLSGCVGLTGGIRPDCGDGPALAGLACKTGAVNQSKHQREYIPRCLTNQISKGSIYPGV
eukprot:471978-Prorocentrum_minimum.AAC.1